MRKIIDYLSVILLTFVLVAGMAVAFPAVDTADGENDISVAVSADAIGSNLMVNKRIKAKWNDLWSGSGNGIASSDTWQQGSKINDGVLPTHCPSYPGNYGESAMGEWHYIHNSSVGTERTFYIDVDLGGNSSVSSGKDSGARIYMSLGNTEKGGAYGHWTYSGGTGFSTLQLRHITSLYVSYSSSTVGGSDVGSANIRNNYYISNNEHGNGVTDCYSFVQFYDTTARSNVRYIRFTVNYTADSNTSNSYYNMFIGEVAANSSLAAPTVSISNLVNNNLSYYGTYAICEPPVITWNAVPGATSYDVYHNGTLYANTTSTTCTLSNTSTYRLYDRPAQVSGVRYSDTCYVVAKNGSASSTSNTLEYLYVDKPTDRSGNPLTTADVIIDAGHGGSDPGAQYYGRRECDDNLNLALKVGKYLEDAGYSVAYTRLTDVFDSKFTKGAKVRAGNYRVFLCLHRNAYNTSWGENSDTNGVEYWSYTTNNGASYAAKLREAVNEDGYFTDRGLKNDAYVMIASQDVIPAVMAEMSYLSNISDNTKFDTYFNETAQSLARGTIRFLGQTVGYEGRIELPQTVNITNNAVTLPNTVQTDNGLDSVVRLKGYMLNTYGISNIRYKIDNGALTDMTLLSRNDLSGNTTYSVSYGNCGFDVNVPTFGLTPGSHTIELYATSNWETTRKYTSNTYKFATVNLNVTDAVYTISFNTNGGAFASGYTVPVNYTLYSSAIQLPGSENVAYAGHTFGGWYDNSGFTGTAVTEIPAGTSGNKVFYAKWNANTYTVTLNVVPSADNSYGLYGAGAGDTVTGGSASVNAVYGGAMPHIDPPSSRSDNNYDSSYYTFMGYFSSPYYNDPDTKQYYDANGNGVAGVVWDVAGSATLYARWRFKMPLELNGGQLPSGANGWFYTYLMATPGYQNLSGHAYTASADDLSAQIPTRTGYDFLGYFYQNDLQYQYYTSAGLPGGDYPGADTYAFWDENRVNTFYARWEPKDISYTVNSYLAGQSGIFYTIENDMTVNGTAQFGTTILISDLKNGSVFEKDGNKYVFKEAKVSGTPVDSVDVDTESPIVINIYYERCYTVNTSFHGEGASVSYSVNTSSCGSYGGNDHYTNGSLVLKLSRTGIDGTNFGAKRLSAKSVIKINGKRVFPLTCVPTYHGADGYCILVEYKNGMDAAVGKTVNAIPISFDNGDIDIYTDLIWEDNSASALLNFAPLGATTNRSALSIGGQTYEAASSMRFGTVWYLRDESFCNTWIRPGAGGKAPVGTLILQLRRVLRSAENNGYAAYIAQRSDTLSSRLYDLYYDNGRDIDLDEVVTVGGVDETAEQWLLESIKDYIGYTNANGETSLMSFGTVNGTDVSVNAEASYYYCKDDGSGNVSFIEYSAVYTGIYGDNKDVKLIAIPYIGFVGGWTSATPPPASGYEDTVYTYQAPEKAYSVNSILDSIDNA